MEFSYMEFIKLDSLIILKHIQENFLKAKVN